MLKVQVRKTPGTSGALVHSAAAARGGQTAKVSFDASLWILKESKLQSGSWEEAWPLGPLALPLFWLSFVSTEVGKARGQHSGRNCLCLHREGTLSLSGIFVSPGFKSPFSIGRNFKTTMKRGMKRFVLLQKCLEAHAYFLFGLILILCVPRIHTLFSLHSLLQPPACLPASPMYPMTLGALPRMGHGFFLKVIGKGRVSETEGHTHTHTHQSGV